MLVKVCVQTIDRTQTSVAELTPVKVLECEAWLNTVARLWNYNFTVQNKKNLSNLEPRRSITYFRL